MTDLRTAAEPKTDQLNFDMLLGGATLTIKVTEVTVALTGEQRVVIHYEGENGRPYKPCKSMIRVLIGVWGADGKQYVGRSMTLYGDPKVVFGGMTVGGIRISHMSHIETPQTIALTVTRSKRAPFTVKPLTTAKPSTTDPDPPGWRSQLWGAVQAAGLTQEQLVAEFGSLKSLPYSRRGEVEAWIQRETVSLSDESVDDIFSEPETCELCQMTGEHSPSCPNASPPNEE